MLAGKDEDDAVNSKSMLKAAELPTATKNNNKTDEDSLKKPTQVKKIQVKTSKGILSITTTIEDSKINDVILEKSKSSSKLKTKPKVKSQIQSTTKDEVVKSAGIPKTVLVEAISLENTTASTKEAKLQKEYILPIEPLKSPASIAVNQESPKPAPVVPVVEVVTKTVSN